MYAPPAVGQVPGWVLIIGGLWSYEYLLFRSDVFRQPVGDAENIVACQREAGELRRKLTVRRGVLAWGAHALVVRLIRLAHHDDVPVKVRLTLVIHHVSRHIKRVIRECWGVVRV